MHAFIAVERRRSHALSLFARNRRERCRELERKIFQGAGKSES